jgi:hypothetical protein
VPGFADYFNSMVEIDDDEDIRDHKTSWDTVELEVDKSSMDVDESLDMNVNQSIALHIPCFAHTIQLCVRDGLKVASTTAKLHKL